MLIILGLILIVAGVLINIGGRLPLRLGRLPGDIAIRGKHGGFYFPIVTCLLLSALVTAILWLVQKR
ncbi:MAG TPA: DUF2905 domain-containing protein [Bryobacteraceae bacterium]|nr:DUF2905 domain-containing protein [Bryobacteraceae bacterium]